MTSQVDKPRIPRERLTRTVRAIAAELAREETHTVECRPPYGEPYQASFRVAALWAFGSWARGAAACGDVDLIADFRRIGDTFPEHRAVANTVRKRRRHVDLHIGTPEELAEVAADSVLLWSVEQPDFEAAINRIAVRESAGRYARQLDVVPLDPRRHLMSFEERDELPAAIETGAVHLDWTHADVVPALDATALRIPARLNLGKASRRVLPLLVRELQRWMDVADIGEGWPYRRDRGLFSARGVRASIERWHHNHDELDELGCRALIVVPHWTARGPNGTLVLTRGTRHPLMIAFATAQAWAVDSGFVQASCSSTADGWRSEAHALTLELFTSREAAAEQAAAWDNDERVVQLISGRALLDAIDRADVVTVDQREDFAITMAGRAYLQAADLVPRDGESPLHERLLRALLVSPA